MKTILLCIDTDIERAKKQVASITTLPLQTDQIHVIVYHVFRSDDGGADAENLKSVVEATDQLEEEGITVEVSQSSGDAVRNILDKAEETDADMINLASRKRSPTGKALFGSVTQNVCLKSGRPVLLSTSE